MTATDYEYLDSETVTDLILDIIGTVPKRWGRMDRLSRLAVVEVGRALKGSGLCWPDHKISDNGRVCLIGGTRRGCLATDLAYAETFAEGLETASPLLFSYTLANIALAEAAGHYNITGPVYALYSENPFTDALAQAKRWLAAGKGIPAAIAGEFDCYEKHAAAAGLTACRFEIVYPI